MKLKDQKVKPIILATQEAEIRRIIAQKPAPAQANSSQDPISKKKKPIT
jgi:hypothetical protein